MRCPFCNYEDSKVTDSRNFVDLNSIKRRRECLKCKNRFTTFETIDLTLQVCKKDGTYEEFNKEKVIKGLSAACCHSKVSHDEMLSLVAKLMAKITAKQIRAISTKELGEMVMDLLQEIDMVAYIRFACVYRRFKDIGEIVEAIESIKSTN
jgi:transcriptional repressor NrdR